MVWGCSQLVTANSHERQNSCSQLLTANSYFVFYGCSQLLTANRPALQNAGQFLFYAFYPFRKILTSFDIVPLKPLIHSINSCILFQFGTSKLVWDTLACSKVNFFVFFWCICSFLGF